MAETTSVNMASSKGESLRTTIPRSIARHFDLKDGDSLSWALDKDADGFFVNIRPAKKRKEAR